jgi:hypothetical protein
MQMIIQRGKYPKLENRRCTHPTKLPVENEEIENQAIRKTLAPS